jgi:hypothetical protein
MFALLNLPFAMSIDISSATKLILNQDRVNQAVMNFEKGNIGVKDGAAIHRQGLYKLNDIVQKLRNDPSSTDKNRDGLAALIHLMDKFHF